MSKMDWRLMIHSLDYWVIVHLRVIASPEIDGDESFHCNVSLKTEERRRKTVISIPKDVAAKCSERRRRRRKRRRITVSIIRGWSSSLVFCYERHTSSFSHIRDGGPGNAKSEPADHRHVKLGNNGQWHFGQFSALSCIVSRARAREREQRRYSRLMVFLLDTRVHMYSTVLLHISAVVVVPFSVCWIVFSYLNFLRAYYSCFMSLSTIIMASSITFALLLLLLFAFARCPYVFNDYLSDIFLINFINRGSRRW